MKKPGALLTFFVALSLALSACDLGGSSSTPIPTMTRNPPLSTPTPIFLPERWPHVWMSDTSSSAGYLYRGFLQIPVGVVWGPDQHLYLADWTGRHVVRIAQDFTMDDLPFWQTVPGLQMDGPRDVDFDSLGNMYVNNHSSIFRVEPNGTVTELEGIRGSPIGSILIGPGNELYYTDRSEQDGALRKWLPPVNSETILTNLPHAESLVFGLDGSLYLTQMGMDHILKVDLNTKTATVFAEDVCGFDPCYLAVDSEGDIWARGIWQLTQLSPDGVIKPYVIDGVTFPPGNYNWHTAGGIAFDDEGGLWVTSYNSKVIHLAPLTPGTPDPEFTFRVAYAGLETSDLAVGPGGEVYGTDMNTHQLLRFSPDGQIEAVFIHQQIGRSAVAVNENGRIFVSLTSGEIVEANPDGASSHYASLATTRMVFGSDGALYAAVGEGGQPRSIVRITGVDEYSTFVTQIAGISLGNGDVHITPALDDGFYVFTEAERNLFFVDYTGQGRLITSLRTLGGGGPVVMAASPVTGDIYYVPHGPYDLFRISPEGASERIAAGVFGDPWGMVVSADGKWLYIAESGAIDRIPISQTP